MPEVGTPEPFAYDLSKEWEEDFAKLNGVWPNGQPYNQDKPLVAGYDQIVGDAWKLRAEGRVTESDELLVSKGIMPDGITDGK